MSHNKNPANRNRTSDHLMAAAIYSQMLYQLSYSRLVETSVLMFVSRLISSRCVPARVFGAQTTQMVTDAGAFGSVARNDMGFRAAGSCVCLGGPRRLGFPSRRLSQHPVTAAMAQSAARRSHNPKVVSSILTGRMCFN